MISLEEANTMVDRFILDLRQIEMEEIYDYRLADLAEHSASELMVIARGTLNIGKIGKKIEGWLGRWKYALKRKKYNGWVPTSQGMVVAFLSDSTHNRATLSPLKVLRDRGVKVQVLTTKEALLSEIRQVGFTAHYCMGVDKSSTEWVKARVHPLMCAPQRQKFFDFLERSEPKYTFLRHYFTNYLRLAKPKYALIGNDLTLEGSLFRECCTQQAVRTGSVQHGSMDSSNPRNAEVEVDDLFVYGKKTFDELEKIGLPSKVMHITGKPGLKFTFDKVESARELKMSVLVGISGKGVLCSEAHHIEIVKGLLEVANHLKEVRWTFKLHPKDSRDYYSPLPPNVEVLTNIDLQRRGTTLDALIEASSLVVSGGSTFSLDAILKGKPVITFDLQHEFAAVPFVVDGLSHYLTTKDELKDFVEQFFSGNIRNEMPLAKIEHYYYKIFNPEYFPEDSIAHYIQAKCAE